MPSTTPITTANTIPTPRIFTLISNGSIQNLCSSCNSTCSTVNTHRSETGAFLTLEYGLRVWNSLSADAQSIVEAQWVAFPTSHFLKNAGKRYEERHGTPPTAYNKPTVPKMMGQLISIIIHFTVHQMVFSQVSLCWESTTWTGGPNSNQQFPHL